MGFSFRETIIKTKVKTEQGGGNDYEVTAGKVFSQKLFNHQGHQVHQENRKTMFFRNLITPIFYFVFLGELGALGG